MEIVLVCMAYKKIIYRWGTGFQGMTQIDSRGFPLLTTILFPLLLALLTFIPRVVVASTPNISLPTPETTNLSRIEQHFVKPIQSSPPCSQCNIDTTKTDNQTLPEGKSPQKVIKFKLNNIKIDNSTVYTHKQLEQYYSSYLGKNISLTDLQNIAKAITARYRQDGHILSLAVIPAQKISNGIVVIRILEGFVSAVYIQGNAKGAHNQIIAAAEKIKQMRPLQMEKLERHILLLNDLPGLTVKSVLSPSTTSTGAADLTFITEQQKISADIAYDNRGTRYLGPHEILATLEINDPFHLADRLVFQTVDTPSTNELRFVQINYTVPLNSNGLRLNLNGNFAETNPGFVINDLDLIGRNKDWSIGLSYPLIRSRNSNLSLYANFEWLDTNTDFITEYLFEDHIRSLRLGASFDCIDKARGLNAINLELSHGLSAFGSSSLDPTTPLSRYHGRSDYTKFTSEVSRLQLIGNRYSLLLAMSGQHSFNQPLLAAEQFAFGGNIYGRGYDPAEFVGDSGIAGKAELRLDTNPNLRFLNQLQYYIFYDAGVAWMTGEHDGIPSQSSGTTAGGGLRANFNKYFYGSLEADRPLTTPVATQILAGENGNAWRFYFSLGCKL